jgi:hypothetical protein
MSTSGNFAIFRTIDTNDLPDVHQLDERLQVFWILTAAKRAPALGELTSSEVAGTLEEICRIAMSRQRAAAILESSKGYVASRKKNGRRHFKIMKRGEDEVSKNMAQPLFIDPEKALTSIRTMENIFETLEGEICICDPYFSGNTLDYIVQCKCAAGVRLLTENVQDSGRAKRDVNAFKEHQIPLEIRVSQKGKLHDRYILHKDGMLLIGTSIKDIGKKQSIVVQISTSFAAEMSKAFDREWGRATKFG